jgi:hypothetical protein
LYQHSRTYVLERGLHVGHDFGLGKGGLRRGLCSKSLPPTALDYHPNDLTIDAVRCYTFIPASLSFFGVALVLGVSTPHLGTNAFATENIRTGLEMIVILPLLGIESPNRLEDELPPRLLIPPPSRLLGEGPGYLGRCSGSLTRS